jgi:hypothetical protein
MTELPEHEDFGDYGRWPGRAVLDPSGRHLGEVREIYLDDATDRPEWVLVELEGEAPRFVPLADATVADDAIRVAQASDRIEAAPALEPSKELTQEEERRLYSHYGLQYSEDESDSLLPDPEQPSVAGTSEAPAAPVAAAPAAEVLAAPKLRRHEVAEPEPAPPEPEPEPEPTPALERAPEAALPAPGETSEPEDTGPMVPPRPEPVAPPRLEPEPAGPLGFVRKRPVPVIAGAAGVLAAIVFVILRRR